MSFTIIDNVIFDDNTLNSMEKLTLMYLMRYENKDKGYSFPSLEILRKHLNYSHTRYVIKNIDGLIDKGYISKEVIKGIGNKYYINNCREHDIPKLDIETKVESVSTLDPKHLITNIDDIWGIYPNKKGKVKAYRRIEKLLKSYSKDEIIRAVERYSSEVKNKDKQYIKHGDTYFNGAIYDYLDENYSKEDDSTIKIEEVTNSSIEDLYS